MFIVHWEEYGKNNMHFRMHKIGLHYYDLEDEELLFVNKVAGNK